MHGLIPLLNRKEPIMKSAVCIICHEASQQHASAQAGDWIIFSDYQAPYQAHSELHNTTESTQTTSHPPGMEFFCNTHLPYAKCFSTMPAKQAISLLKQNLALYDLTPNTPKPSWWKRWLTR
jgi:hypothetical protein